MEKEMTTAKGKVTDAWDDGALGRDEAHVERADGSHEAALDEALEMRSISIRLPKQLIKQYKLIANYHGVGYQPLMRDVMARFVPNALKEILEEEQKKAAVAAKEATIPEPLKKVA
jgi:predicted DNA binding CopG/RHH family protein